MVRPERFELEPFCGRERSGSPQAKSRAERGICGIMRCRGKTGAPGEIRTPDLQLRRLPLYPAELRARGGNASVHRVPGLPQSGRGKVRRSAFDRCQRTLLPPIRLQNLLAQAQGFRRNLDELIVGNEFNSLFKIEIA